MTAPVFVSPATAGLPVITVAEARAAITSARPTGRLADDDTVQLYVDAATDVVEGVVKSPIVVRQKTWGWSGSGPRGGDVAGWNNSGSWSAGGITALQLPWPILPGYDLTVTENGVLLRLGVDYDVDYQAAMLHRGHYPGWQRWALGIDDIAILAWVGREAVPAALKLAVLEEFSFLWRIGQQGPRPAWGNDQAGVAADWQPSGFAVPKRVMELCQFEPGLPGFA